MSLEQYKQEKLKELFEDIDGVDVDSIQINGISIRSGDKVLKLQVVSEEPITIEEEIREEYRLKLSEKLSAIKDKLNTKISEIVQHTTQIRMEAERAERELKEKLKKAKPMPDISERHAAMGLSVVKGDGSNELIWLFQGVYWPKTVDGQSIEPRYSKRLLTQITFKIKTVDDRVIRVSTHQPIGMNSFDHYHQQNPDCWGKWHPPGKWSTPDDIIKIGKAAEAVLENVNSHSLANRSPAGLPRFNTLKRHLLKVDSEKKKEAGVLNQMSRRTGMTANVREEDGDVWSV